MNFARLQEEKHAQVKEDAKIIWGRLENPTSDGQLDPEYGMSADEISAAKRGKRCAIESFACGSTQTRRAIRDHARASRQRGEVGMESERLLEYPRARRRYVELMSELHRRAEVGQKKGKSRRYDANGMSAKIFFGSEMMYV